MIQRNDRRQRISTLKGRAQELEAKLEGLSNSLVQKPGLYMAMAERIATAPNELSMQKFQSLRVVMAYSDGWGHCVNEDTGEEGVVPLSLLKSMDGFQMSEMSDQKSVKEKKLLKKLSISDDVLVKEPGVYFCVRERLAERVNEISLEKGQEVRVLMVFSDGWGLCLDESTGEQGIAPLNILKLHGFDLTNLQTTSDVSIKRLGYYRVLVDRIPIQANEIMLLKGNVVHVSAVFSDGWCHCMNIDTLERGDCPFNVLDWIEDQDSSQNLNQFDKIETVFVESVQQTVTVDESIQASGSFGVDLNGFSLPFASHEKADALLPIQEVSDEVENEIMEDMDKSFYQEYMEQDLESTESQTITHKVSALEVEEVCEKSIGNGSLENAQETVMVTEVKYVDFNAEKILQSVDVMRKNISNNESNLNDKNVENMQFLEEFPAQNNSIPTQVTDGKNNMEEKQPRLNENDLGKEQQEKEIPNTTRTNFKDVELNVAESNTTNLVETNTTNLVETNTSNVAETSTNNFMETNTSIVAETNATYLVETNTSNVAETNTNNLMETNTSIVAETNTSADTLIQEQSLDELPRSESKSHQESEIEVVTRTSIYSSTTKEYTVFSNSTGDLPPLSEQYIKRIDTFSAETDSGITLSLSQPFGDSKVEILQEEKSILDSALLLENGLKFIEIQSLSIADPSIAVAIKRSKKSLLTKLMKKLPQDSRDMIGILRLVRMISIFLLAVQFLGFVCYSLVNAFLIFKNRIRSIMPLQFTAENIYVWVRYIFVDIFEIDRFPVVTGNTLAILALLATVWEGVLLGFVNQIMLD